MKITLQLLVYVWLLLPACNTPHYATVNNMSGQPATLYLQNNTVLQGKVSIRSFDNYSTVNSVRFAAGSTNEYKEFFVTDIKSLYINGGTYCVKKLTGSNFWSGQALRFVLQLTQPGGKMDLYQHETIIKNTTTGKDEKQTAFYVQLPGATNNQVYNIESAMFTPNFDDKMSSYVNDCPELADKIKRKEKDYFYAFVVNNAELKHKTVLLQIINDYNHCNN